MGRNLAVIEHANTSLKSINVTKLIDFLKISMKLQ